MSELNLFEYFKSLDTNLVISHCELTDYDFNIAGDKWWLYSLEAEWRITKGSEILFTKYELDENNEQFPEKVKAISQLLIGQEISDILPLSDFMIGSENGDIKFVFTTGIELHLFATNIDEPWVLRLPGLFFVP